MNVPSPSLNHLLLKLVFFFSVEWGSCSNYRRGSRFETLKPCLQGTSHITKGSVITNMVRQVILFQNHLFCRWNFQFSLIRMSLCSPVWSQDRWNSRDEEGHHPWLPTISIITVPLQVKFIHLKDIGSTGKAWHFFAAFSCGGMPILWLFFGFLGQQRLVMKNMMKHDGTWWACCVFAFASVYSCFCWHVLAKKLVWAPSRFFDIVPHIFCFSRFCHATPRRSSILETWTSSSLA